VNASKSKALALLLGVMVASSSASAAETCLKLWHSYRGEEAAALKQIVEGFQGVEGNPCVEALAVPYDVFASKLTTALGQSNGPDVFVFAHERLGDWSRANLLAPIDARLDASAFDAFDDVSKQAVTLSGKTWALPLAVKSVALLYRTDLLEAPPKTTDELIAVGERLKAKGITALAYPTDNFYFHAPWFFGHGGALLDEQGVIDFGQAPFSTSIDFVRDLQKRGLVPEEVTNALVSRLFIEGKVAMVESGPWFLGELPEGTPFAVAPLPVVSSTGKPARPFVTVEAAYLGKDAVPGAEKLALAIAGPEGAKVRAEVGKQIVPVEGAVTDPVLAAFARAASQGTVMDARPEMRNAWEPGDLALKKALRAGATGEAASVAAVRRYQIITREKPEPRDPKLFRIVVLGLALLALGYFLKRAVPAVRGYGAGKTVNSWIWVAPAMFTTGLLVIVPFAVAMGLAFFSHDAGNYTFVGLANFAEILTSTAYGALEPLSFYYSLLVTVAWTAANVVVHIGVGLLLALALFPKARKLKAFYRVVLILPWAMPNYITALIWKSLFHKQLGAINGALEALGLERVSWFSSFGTAFFANLCANWWLGFPFMMVVCLGALQSIPTDLYEAAQIDGASRVQQLKHVTLPLLKPALLPASLLGVVWTFNAFNIVYLVSGGEPENGTDILISEAWRWGFARREQYGYAAAYGVMIFLLLLGWSALSTRWLKAAEEGR
jgi:arabinogalactan oligomer/maltooligosaccharide transport system permease protein